jgi:hypothetical protein
VFFLPDKINHEATVFDVKLKLPDL